MIHPRSAPPTIQSIRNENPQIVLRNIAAPSAKLATGCRGRTDEIRHTAPTTIQITPHQARSMIPSTGCVAPSGGILIDPLV